MASRNGTQKKLQANAQINRHRVPNSFIIAEDGGSGYTCTSDCICSCSRVFVDIDAGVGMEINCVGGISTFWVHKPVGFNYEMYNIEGFFFKHVPDFVCCIGQFSSSNFLCWSPFRNA